MPNTPRVWDKLCAYSEQTREPVTAQAKGECKTSNSLVGTKAAKGKSEPVGAKVQQSNLTDYR